VTRTFLACIAAVTVLAGRAPLRADEPAVQATPDRVAAFKQALAENQKRLRQYEWIETTIISLKGEEKARKQQRCYYGADGKVQKLPVDSQPEPAAREGRGGRRGRMAERIVENKKDEMQDYMEKAVALVHRYLPPDPAQVQRARDAGHLNVQPVAQGQVKLDFTDYLLAGDRLGLDLDAANNRVLGVNVNTYLDKPEDKVTLVVKMGSLTDGTSHVEQATFDATAKNIKVVVQNSGYRPAQR
jgi:hypothetical protein